MSKRWIVLGRGLWILLALNGLYMFVLTQWVALQFLQTPSVRLTQGLAELNLSLEVYAIFSFVSITIMFLVYFIVALSIFLRRPNDGFALFASIFLLGFGAANAYPQFAEFLQFYLNPPTWYGIPALISTLSSWPILIAFLVLFPDGHFVPRWSLVLTVLAFFLTVAWGLFPNAFSVATSPLSLFGAVSAVLLTGGSFYAQIWRYRHYSSPLQRQQTKWFVFALAIYLVFTVLSFLAPIQFSRMPTAAESIWGDLVATTNTLSSVVLPVAIGISILRYRLFGIDVIIRKTLVYGALTALLALIYFGSIALLQGLVTSVSGQSSAIVIVLSTLTIAALFSPLRHRIQDVIDRRFFRKKYEAGQVLARFAQTARDETDLDSLTAELAQVVQETMQPERVSVWLREESAVQNRG